MEDHSLIINRKDRLVSVWNGLTEKYHTLSFEIVKDLAIIIGRTDDVPGVIYINEEEKKKA